MNILNYCSITNYLCATKIKQPPTVYYCGWIQFVAISKETKLENVKLLNSVVKVYKKPLKKGAGFLLQTPSSAPIPCHNWAVPCRLGSGCRWVGQGAPRQRAARCQNCPWSGRRWCGRAPRRSSPCPGTFWSHGAVWTVHLSQHHLGREGRKIRKSKKCTISQKSKTYSQSSLKNGGKIQQTVQYVRRRQS